MYDFESPALMIRLLLIDSIASLDASNTFAGTMRSTPNTAICVYDSPVGDQIDNQAIDTYGIQIKARGSYKDAYAILNDIKLELQSYPSIVLNDGSKIAGLWSKSNIATVGKDDQDRFEFVTNFMLMIDSSQIGHRGFNFNGEPSEPHVPSVTEHIDFNDLPYLP